MRKLKIKLKEILKQRNMTQLELSKLSNVRQAAISELCRNERKEINLEQIERIATALNITKISELLEFQESD
ncbi:helix-turn-helix domain-containing protein [Paenibacillus elgii]|uniref:XRE family transcriptional regulator n=2 Tax=Paenibacillus elgii TaxID=189691 RepID=A0A2T6G8K6_9BACL|nr:helix-turn-helix transcriptional regulator [Paenibacillus elgii]MCM3274276.1 helix-turn-helix transcriptional regulator [Paenibacillus elgii]NEN83201.1 helix-turn-helix transcriptional regulator [Paenibacillus elgii]PUA40480.1 XRE family transcriptional regulator [Paenibacillus elgii]